MFYITVHDCFFFSDSVIFIEENYYLHILSITVKIIKTLTVKLLKLEQLGLIV